MAGAQLDVSVVLPTYNESASLPVLVPRIAQALEAAGLRYEVIVVDDNSPDGTAEVARELAQRHPVRVEKRTSERGLATAVIAGFRMSQAEVCVVMDADGSHPVEALGGMVRLILEDKAEIVVGSRHVPGGGSTDWPLFSQLKSRFAASLAFALTSMTDPTTGFMAIRRTLFERLTLDPVGWKIVLEAVVKAHPARLAEVPIVFTDREHGESKQSLRVLRQYLEHLYKLYSFRFPTLVELFKFCLVGFLGVFVDLSIVATLKQQLAMDTRLCQVFGFTAAVTFNYAINRRFSFAAARNTPLLFSYVAYVAANMLGLTVRMMAIHGLMRVTELDRGSGYLLLSGIGIALATLVNFVGVKYFAFSPERLARKDDSLPSEVPSADQRSLAPGFALIALSCALLVGLGMARSERTHDEQVNLVMAENIRAGREGFVHPSVTPGIARNWQAEALPQVGNTPVYPLVLAVAEGAGKLGLAALCALVWLAALLGSAAAIGTADRSATLSTLAMVAGSPALFASYLLLEFEPLVASLGVLGFAALRRAADRKNLGYALLAGAAVGLGFALKMWLVTPAALACFAFSMSRIYRSSGEARAGHRRAFALFALTFVVFALSHLAFVALVAPGDLRAWVHTVYLGIFSGEGVTGPKLSKGESSAFDYVSWLLRDHGAVLVPIVLGLPAATRRVTANRRAIFAALIGALAALVPLSVPASKEPLYLLPVLPFLYLLAGLSLSAPEHEPVRFARVHRGAARASLFVAALLAAGIVLRFVFAPAEPWLAVVRVGHVAAWCLPSLATLRGRPATSMLVPAALLSLLLCALAAKTGAALAMF